MYSNTISFSLISGHQATERNVIMENYYVYKENKKVIVNTTPHEITFLKGEDIIKIPSEKEFLLNAKVVETQVGADLVTSTFVGSEEGEKIIAQLQDWANENYPSYDLRIVGSIIAAQAYPEKVVGMTPAPGYERVAPAEKRMSLDKFTVFMK